VLSDGDDLNIIKSWRYPKGMNIVRHLMNIVRHLACSMSGLLGMPSINVGCGRASLRFPHKVSFEKKKLKGLVQSMVANVIEHLASSLTTGA